MYTYYLSNLYTVIAIFAATDFISMVFCRSQNQMNWNKNGKHFFTNVRSRFLLLSYLFSTYSFGHINSMHIEYRTCILLSFLLYFHSIRRFTATFHFQNIYFWHYAGLNFNYFSPSSARIIHSHNSHSFSFSFIIYI